MARTKMAKGKCNNVLNSSFCQSKNIEWRFIAELSPWQGGFYERLIGLVKHCLRRTLDKTLLTNLTVS
jgi:hypothetical protein